VSQKRRLQCCHFGRMD